MVFKKGKTRCECMSSASSQLLTCPNCKAPIDKKSKYCGNCGQRLEDVVDKNKCAWCGRKIRWIEDKRPNPIGEGRICERCMQNQRGPCVKFNTSEEGPILVGNGFNGTLRAYKDFVEIDRTHIPLYLQIGDLHGVKRLYFKDITAIAFKKAGVRVGYIKFSIIGGQDSHGIAAVSNENAVTFDKFNKQWEEIYNHLQSMLGDYKKNH